MRALNNNGGCYFMNLWIFNHYAALMYVDGDGRHHGLAKYLISKGVKVKIFCADFLHGVDEAIEIEDGKYTCKTGEDGVEYVIIKTTAYKNNGLSRIKNMIDYYFRVRKVANEIAKKEGTPDIILASSVHPLALIAGEKFAKKHHIPCLCEIRDLWPETLVELGYLSEKKLLTRLMYRGEHSIYRKSQGVIFTMPGGKDYIKDRGWQDDVPLDKVYHISNGVDLDKFRFDVENNIVSEELLNTNKFKIVYAGSIRRVNKVDELVSMRIVEGENLNKDLLDNLLAFENNLENIKERKEDVLNNQIEKLKLKLNEFSEELSESEVNRLNLEVIFYTDKLDISEEITRLHSHIQNFKKFLNLESQVGKKIEFLLQEMNREINTIASKSNNYAISTYVIEMKVIIEKLREQIQNVE